jgi:hypothetical protein
VPLLARAWTLGARLRRRLGHAGLPPYRELFGPHVRGRSFADVGAMWSVHGRYAFEAEEAGAAPVTAFDGMAPTPEYEAEHVRRSSRVRFVRGDINDLPSVERLGRHDVVWCSGLVYHSPDPVLTIRHLCEVTGEMLLLASRTLPELPGLPQATVFLPGLGDPVRRSFGRVFGEAEGLTTPFNPHNWSANWWWGLTPSALEAMVAVQPGFEVVERHRRPLDTLLVATRVRRP